MENSRPPPPPPPFNLKWERQKLVGDVLLTQLSIIYKRNGDYHLMQWQTAWSVSSRVLCAPLLYGF